MPSLTKCSNSGCAKSFNAESERLEFECEFHPGGPVFHEGFKSWSCCPEMKRVEWEDFMRIPGCTTGSHKASTSSSEPVPEAKPSETPVQPKPLTIDKPRETGFVAPVAAPKPETPAQEDQKSSWKITHDAKGFKPTNGQTCRRTGCAAQYPDSNEKCKFHPGPPMFREGSKGYMCCKPRVLEFSDFLSLPGCTEQDAHQFSELQPLTEQPKLRMDHYQTPSTIVASIYAKGVKVSGSLITFKAQSVAVKLVLSDDSIYENEIMLYGSIAPEQSQYEILRTKIELNLTKADGKSWPSLHPVDESKLPKGFAITFGAGGQRGGTVGGQQIFVDPSLAA